MANCTQLVSAASYMPMTSKQVKLHGPTHMTDPYGEPITGQNWWGWIDLIADGKIYLGTLEHSAENPLPRGAPYMAVNASNGAEIWRVNGMFRETRWGGNGVIGDSIIATMDTYDQRVYGIGKGATQTTIVAPTSSIDSGKAIIVQGTSYRHFTRPIRLRNNTHASPTVYQQSLTKA